MVRFKEKYKIARHRTAHRVRKLHRQKFLGCCKIENDCGFELWYAVSFVLGYEFTDSSILLLVAVKWSYHIHSNAFDYKHIKKVSNFNHTKTNHS